MLNPEDGGSCKAIVQVGVSKLPELEMEVTHMGMVVIRMERTNEIQEIFNKFHPRHYMEAR